MTNGPDINTPILMIQKTGGRRNINQSVIDAVVTFGTEAKGKIGYIKQQYDGESLWSKLIEPMI